MLLVLWAGSIAQLVGMVFVFLLASRVYGGGIGIIFDLLTLLPCFGLLVSLPVNGRATAILGQNGHHVGLLGANLAEFRWQTPMVTKWWILIHHREGHSFPGSPFSRPINLLQ